VVRTFVDRLTEPGKINLVLAKGERTRGAQYKANRRIKVMPSS
jgi:hypothetical protein